MTHRISFFLLKYLDIFLNSLLIITKVETEFNSY